MKLAQFVSKFIRPRRPGFPCYETSPDQLHCAIVEEENNQDDNPGKADLKTLIKPRTAHVWLNKLGHRYTNIK